MKKTKIFLFGLLLVGYTTSLFSGTPYCRSGCLGCGAIYPTIVTAFDDIDDKFDDINVELGEYYEEKVLPRQEFVKILERKNLVVLTQIEKLQKNSLLKQKHINAELEKYHKLLSVEGSLLTQKKQINNLYTLILKELNE